MDNFKGSSPHHPISDSSEIRIVILYPGHFDEPIICDLQHIYLLPEGCYEAVSYSWGSDPTRKLITLDGQEYPVTPNLFTGLQYLRRTDIPRRLWVDSLCINQSDGIERGREVQKIRDIYKFASDVIIWLGDYAPFTRPHVELIFEHLELLGSCCTVEKQEQAIKRLGWETLWRFQTGIAEFIKSRRWFERMWIIQEVSVRPNVTYMEPEKSPRLHCGSLRLPAVYLRDTIRWWVKQKRDESFLTLPPVLTSAYRLYILWWKYQAMCAGPPDETPSLGASLSSILATVAGEFHCTDERDIIYALLGLLPGPLPKAVEPNYIWTPAKVFRDYAIYILETIGHLEIIQYTSGLSKGSSWVPDWKVASPHAIRDSDSRHPQVYVRIVGHGKGLEVDMLTLAEVKRCGPMLTQPKDPSTLFESLHRIFQQVEDTLGPEISDLKAETEFRRRLYELLTRFDLHKRQLRDSSFHCLASRKALYRLHGYDDHLWLDSEEDITLSNRPSSITHVGEFQSEELWKSILETVQNKHLFNCSDGTVGVMAQSYVMPTEGDIVCSLKGARGEVVLRPCVGGYRLIGRCERTVQGFNCHMDDVDIAEWVLKAHTLSVYEALWSTAPMRRIVLW